MYSVSPTLWRTSSVRSTLCTPWTTRTSFAFMAWCSHTQWRWYWTQSNKHNTHCILYMETNSHLVYAAIVSFLPPHTYLKALLKRSLKTLIWIRSGISRLLFWPERLMGRWRQEGRGASWWTEKYKSFPPICPLSRSSFEVFWFILTNCVSHITHFDQNPLSSTYLLVFLTTLSNLICGKKKKNLLDFFVNKSFWLGIDDQQWTVSHCNICESRARFYCSFYKRHLFLLSSLSSTSRAIKLV